MPRMRRKQRFDLQRQFEAKRKDEELQSVNSEEKESITEVEIVENNDSANDIAKCDIDTTSENCEKTIEHSTLTNSASSIGEVDSVDADTKNKLNNINDSLVSAKDAPHESTFSEYSRQRDSNFIYAGAQNSTMMSFGDFIEPVKDDFSCVELTQVQEFNSTDLSKSSGECICASDNIQTTQNLSQSNLVGVFDDEAKNKFQGDHSSFQRIETLIDITNVMHSNQNLRDTTVNVTNEDIMNITSEQQKEPENSNNERIVNTNKDCFVSASEKLNESHSSGNGSTSADALMMAFGQQNEPKSSCDNITSDGILGMASEQNPVHPISNDSSYSSIRDGTGADSTEPSNTNTAFNMQKPCSQTLRNPFLEFAMIDQITEFSVDTKKDCLQSVEEKEMFGNQNSDATNSAVDTVSSHNRVKGIKDIDSETKSNNFGLQDNPTAEISFNKKMQCSQNDIVDIVNCYTELEDVKDTEHDPLSNNILSSLLQSKDAAFYYHSDGYACQPTQSSLNSYVIGESHSNNYPNTQQNDIKTSINNRLQNATDSDANNSLNNANFTHIQENASLISSNKGFHHCSEIEREIFDRMYKCKILESQPPISKKHNEVCEKVTQSVETAVSEGSLTYPNVPSLHPAIPLSAPCLADSMSEKYDEMDKKLESHSAESPNGDLYRPGSHVDCEAIRRYVIGQIFKEGAPPSGHDTAVHHRVPGSFINQTLLRDYSFNDIKTTNSEYPITASAKTIDSKTHATSDEGAVKLADGSNYTLSRLCKKFVDSQYQKLCQYLPCNLLDVSLETSEWEVRILFEIGLKALRSFAMEFETNKSFHEQSFDDIFLHTSSIQNSNIKHAIHTEHSLLFDFSTLNSNKSPETSSSCTQQQLSAYDSIQEYSSPVVRKQMRPDVSNCLNLSKESKNEVIRRECARLRLSREGTRLEESFSLLCLKERDVNALNGPNTPYSRLLASTLDTKQVNTEGQIKFEQSQFASVKEKLYEYLCIAVAEFYTGCIMYLTLPDSYIATKSEPETDQNFVLNNWLIGAKSLMGRNLEIIAVNIDKVGRTFNDTLRAIISLQNHILSTVYLIKDSLLTLSNKLVILKTISTESRTTLTQLITIIKN